MPQLLRPSNHRPALQVRRATDVARRTAVGKALRKESPGNRHLVLWMGCFRRGLGRRRLLKIGSIQNCFAAFSHKVQGVKVLGFQDLGFRAQWLGKKSSRHQIAEPASNLTLFC